MINPEVEKRRHEAGDQLAVLAHEKMEEKPGLTFKQAFNLLKKERPQLYKEYLYGGSRD